MNLLIICSMAFGSAIYAAAMSNHLHGYVVAVSFVCGALTGTVLLMTIVMLAHWIDGRIDDDGTEDSTDTIAA